MCQNPVVTRKIWIVLRKNNESPTNVTKFFDKPFRKNYKAETILQYKKHLILSFFKFLSEENNFFAWKN